TVAAGGFVALVLVAAMAPELLTGDTPTRIDLPNALAAPSWQHPFGTDEAGRDLLTRVIHGTRLSLGIGLAATGVSMVLAIVLGATAALAGGVVDAVINRILEVTFAFPSLLAALLIVAVYGPSVTTSIVAVGVGSMPGYARMVRGQVLAGNEAGYIESAQALGHGPGTVFRRHPRNRAVDRLGLEPGVPRPGSAAAQPGVGRAARLGPQPHHDVVVARDPARTGDRALRDRRHVPGPHPATATGRSDAMTAGT